MDRTKLVDWVAVDDHPEGWAEADRDRLIHTDSSKSISDPNVLEMLIQRLGSFMTQRKRESKLNNAAIS